jgi:hypothetical protein
MSKTSDKKITLVSDVKTMKILENRRIVIVPLSIAPVMKSGVLMVPAEEIAQELGYQYLAR